MTPPRPLPAASWVGSRSLSSPAFVPESDLVSFVVRGSSGSALVLSNEAGGPEHHLLLDPPLGGPYFWTNEFEVMYLGTDSCLYVFDTRDGSSECVSEVLEVASGLALSPDAKRIAYCQDMARIVVVDLTTSSTRIVETGDFVVDPTWSPDGKSIAWVEWNVPNMAWDSSRLILCDVVTGERQVIAGGDSESVQQPMFNPAGTHIGYVSDRHGFANVWTTELSTGEAKPVFEESFEHAGPLWGSGAHTWAWVDDKVVVCRNEGGRWRLASDVVDKLKVPATSVISDGQRLLVTSAGARTASGICVVDVVRQTVQQVARATGVGVEQHGLDPEDVHWKAKDGSVVHGRLYSATNEALPLLVWLHGGPTDQSAVSLHHRLGYFVERGWALLAVDYRGSTGWGREYQQALRTKWGIVDVQDVIDGVRTMIASGRAEPESIVVWGGSAGGFTGLGALAAAPDLFAAGVFMYPVSDLTEMTTTHRLEAHYNETLVGSLEADPALYRNRSIGQLTHRISAPMLILHGDKDEVVSLEQSQALAQDLSNSGLDIELHVYEGERHGWRSSATKIDELERIERFLKTKVRPTKGEAI